MYLGDFPPLNFAKTVGGNGGDKVGAHIVSKNTKDNLIQTESMPALGFSLFFFFFFKNTYQVVHGNAFLYVSLACL